MSATYKTLTNSYHHTSYRTRKTDADIEAIELRIYNGNASAADKEWVRKVRNTLCGATGCTCGDFIGRRA